MKFWQNVKWFGGFFKKHCAGKGIVFRRPDDFRNFELAFLGYSDSSWADCVFTMRSSGGYLVFFFGMLISWASGKTKATQSTSVGEAELWVAYLLSKELIYLMDLARELGIFDSKSLRSSWVCLDSKSAIGLVTKHNKHWDIRCFYLRAQNDLEKLIKFIWVETFKKYG